MARCARISVLLATLGLAALPAPAFGQACTACHADASLLERLTTDSAEARRLWVDAAGFAASAHGEAGLACTACHEGVEGYPHGDVPPAGCARCHDAPRREWAASIHGRPHPRTGSSPATCTDCHGIHEIRHVTDPQSPLFRLSRFEVCAGCHENARIMAGFGQQETGRVASYLRSVHGRALVEKGLVVASTCTDCHGSTGDGAHGLDRVASATSLMNRANVVAACGTCHLGIQNEYSRGIHGQAFAAGNPDVPTCIDCHTEHGIQRVTSPESSVYPTHVVQTCSACHEREELNERYGLPLGRRGTFLGSFHGIALESGQLTVANCASCHGAHGILPSSDPRSSVHPANLVRTCGACHPGIGRRVAEGRIHVASLGEELGLLGDAVRWFYYFLIAGMVVFAAVMISLDQYRHRVVDPRRERDLHG